MEITFQGFSARVRAQVGTSQEFEAPRNHLPLRKQAASVSHGKREGWRKKESPAGKESLGSILQGRLTSDGLGGGFESGERSRSFQIYIWENVINIWHVLKILYVINYNKFILKILIRK